MKIPKFLSHIYASIGRMRRYLYECGLLKIKQLPLPVVSIGNITSGGVGKTPLTILLCSSLAEQFRICTLSRGYKAAAEKKESPTLISEWGHLTPNAHEGGDEPSLLASRLPKCSVIAGKNRYACGQKAHTLGAQLLILDDGFQHLKLYRNYDIVVVDATNPWGGLLREPKRSLEKADLIAITQADQIPTNKLEKLKQEIAIWTSAPITSFYLAPPQAYNAHNEPTQLKGKRIAALCGIGNPQRFVATLEQAGGKVVDLFSWPDHSEPNRKKLDAFIAAHKDVDLLLCTEKDWVRFHPISSRPPSIGYLRIDLKPFANNEQWSEALSKIAKLKTV